MQNLLSSLYLPLDVIAIENQAIIGTIGILKCESLKCKKETRNIVSTACEYF